MAELRNNAGVYLSAYNYRGETVASQYAQNGQGLTLDLANGQPYKIQVRQHSGLSPYYLKTGHQKETADISLATSLADSLEFTGQRNRYAFTARRDGTYRFEMAELRNNAGVYLSAYNYLGETIASQYAQNGQGLTLDLAGGQSYEIQVRQHSGLSPYVLRAGSQKATVQVNRMERIYDSMQFTSQRNRYLFTAPGNGTYRFEMAELRNNAGVYLSAYNYLGETIASQYAQNGQGLALNLSGGQSYEIQVRQHSGFSPYALIIAKQ